MTGVSGFKGGRWKVSTYLQLGQAGLHTALWLSSPLQGHSWLVFSPSYRLAVSWSGHQGLEIGVSGVENSR